jgi:hypothetical protein
MPVEPGSIARPSPGAPHAAIAAGGGCARITQGIVS